MAKRCDGVGMTTEWIVSIHWGGRQAWVGGCMWLCWGWDGVMNEAWQKKK